MPCRKTRYSALLCAGPLVFEMFGFGCGAPGRRMFSYVFSGKLWPVRAGFDPWIETPRTVCGGSDARRLGAFG